MSDCDVCIGGEGDPIQDYTIGLVTANCAVRCSECRRVISKGKEHERITGKYDGTRISWRTCMDCRNIATGLSCDGRVHGTLWTDLEGDGPTDEYAAFNNFSEVCVGQVETASAKAYLVKRWQKWKGLVPA